MYSFSSLFYCYRFIFNLNLSSSCFYLMFLATVLVISYFIGHRGRIVSFFRSRFSCKLGRYRSYEGRIILSFCRRNYTIRLLYLTMSQKNKNSIHYFNFDLMKDSYKLRGPNIVPWKTLGDEVKIKHHQNKNI